MSDSNTDNNAHDRLVVRLPNWVGDVVMAIPTVAALKQAGWDVALVGRRWAGELLEGLGMDFATLPKNAWAAGRTIRTLHARRGVLLTNSFSSALAFRLAGVASVGYRSDRRGWLLAKGIEKPTGLHEVEVFWRVGQAACQWWLAGDGAGIMEAPPQRIELPLTPTHRYAAQEALHQNDIDAGYVVCCPLATGTIAGRPKKWPGFVELARRLQHAGLRVVACPGPGEEEETAAALPGATVLPGLSLGAYAAVLAGADRVVANDSGPMHLAAAVGAAVGAAVIGVFGVTDPARTRPWGGVYVGGADGWPTLDEVWAAIEEARPSQAA